MEVRAEKTDLVEKYCLSQEILADYKTDRIIEMMRKNPFSSITLCAILKVKKLCVSIYALDFAIVNKNDPIIDFVIDFYKETDFLNSPTSKSKLTPLHIAAMTGHCSAAKKLLEDGADVNSRDCKKWTPLHHAALTGNEEMVSLLIEKGTDIEAMTVAKGRVGYFDADRFRTKIL